MKTMKTIMFVLFGLLIVCTATAQTKKEAKRLQREGWQPRAGISLVEMLEEAKEKREEKITINNSETERYIFAVGNGVAKSKNAAHAQALAFAKQTIQGLIKTELAASVIQKIANSQQELDDAVTEDEITSVCLQKIEGTLTGLQPVVDIYKENENTIEVEINLFFDRKTIEAVADGEVRKHLKEELKKQEEELLNK